MDFFLNKRQFGEAWQYLPLANFANFQAEWNAWSLWHFSLQSFYSSITNEKDDKEGDQVLSDSILCSLEDAAFSETSQLFKSEALDTLRVFANATPRAKYEGKIAKIECIYFGDPETAQISESVKALITKYDNIRKKQATLMKDGRPTTGKLLNSVRVDGNPLLKDHVAIKIYIENTDGVTSGDKFVVNGYSPEWNILTPSLIDGEALKLTTLSISSDWIDG